MSTDDKDYNRYVSNQIQSAEKDDRDAARVAGLINGLAFHHAQTFEKMSKILAHANRQE